LRWGGAGRSGAVRRGDRQTLRGRFVPAQSEFARPGKTGGGPPCNIKSNLMGFGSTRVPVRDKPALNPGPEIRPWRSRSAGSCRLGGRSRGLGARRRRPRSCSEDWEPAMGSKPDLDF
jgi:hypothetical protein